MEILRKIYEAKRINWVEALPQTLHRYHDVPNLSGLSPYQIVSGWHRPMGNVPYVPTSQCEDAQDFFARMKEVDLAVSQKLNELRARVEAKMKSQLKGSLVFHVGDLVWYRRPERSGHKRDTRWLGKAVVTARESESSYVIEVRPGSKMKVHARFLKPWLEDEVVGNPTPLFYHQRTEIDPGLQVDEWICKKILGHRVVGDSWEFLTEWEGAEDSPTWDPPGNFVHRCSSEFVKYCHHHRVKFDLVQHLVTQDSREVNRVVCKFGRWAYVREDYAMRHEVFEDILVVWVCLNPALMRLPRELIIYV